MPPLRRYRVTQTREIIVTATGPTNAALLADRVFSGTKKPEDQIDIISYPHETGLDIKEER